MHMVELSGQDVEPRACGELAPAQCSGGEPPSFDLVAQCALQSCPECSDCLLTLRQAFCRVNQARTQPVQALLVVGQVYGLLAGLLLGNVYQWISDSSLPAALIQEPLGLLDFALTCVLPLWLCLRLGAKAPAAAGFAPRHEAALLLALSIALLSLKGLLLVPLYLQEGGWVSLVYFAPLLYGALVFACAWQTLPHRLARIRPGQLVLTALAIFLVWLLVHLLVAGVLLVSAFSGSDALLQPAPLIIAGLAVLALLWPLTLLGLRWIYRAEAA